MSPSYASGAGGEGSAKQHRPQRGGCLASVVGCEAGPGNTVTVTVHRTVGPCSPRVAAPACLHILGRSVAISIEWQVTRRCWQANSAVHPGSATDTGRAGPWPSAARPTPHAVAVKSPAEGVGCGRRGIVAEVQAPARCDATCKLWRRRPALLGCRARSDCAHVYQTLGASSSIYSELLEPSRRASSSRCSVCPR